jgi:toxin ParE1/3/4
MNEIEYISNCFDDGKSMEHIKKNYKVSKIKSHVIFYRKNKEDVIVIIRVLDERMDIEIG